MGGEERLLPDGFNELIYSVDILRALVLRGEVYFSKALFHPFLIETVMRTVVFLANEQSIKRQYLILCGHYLRRNDQSGHDGLNFEFDLHLSTFGWVYIVDRLIDHPVFL